MKPAGNFIFNVIVGPKRDLAKAMESVFGLFNLWGISLNRKSLNERCDTRDLSFFEGLAEEIKDQGVYITQVQLLGDNTAYVFSKEESTVEEATAYVRPVFDEPGYRLLYLLESYDIYIQGVNDADLYADGTLPVSLEEFYLNGVYQDFPHDGANRPLYSNVSRRVLCSLTADYDRYVQHANSENLYQDGWRPVSVEEFYESEFRINHALLSKKPTSMIVGPEAKAGSYLMGFERVLKGLGIHIYGFRELVDGHGKNTTEFFFELENVLIRNGYFVQRILLDGGYQAFVFANEPISIIEANEVVRPVYKNEDKDTLMHLLASFEENWQMAKAKGEEFHPVSLEEYYLTGAFLGRPGNLSNYSFLESATEKVVVDVLKEYDEDNKSQINLKAYQLGWRPETIREFYEGEYQVLIDSADHIDHEEIWECLVRFQYTDAEISTRVEVPANTDQQLISAMGREKINQLGLLANHIDLNHDVEITYL